MIGVTEVGVSIRYRVVVFQTEEQGELILVESIEVFEEEEPRGLLGVVELGGAVGFFPEDIVDILEGLF